MSCLSVSMSNNTIVLGNLLQENLDSLVKVLKNNIDTFKRRIAIPTLHYEDIVKNKQRQVPIFHVDVNLTIPTISLSPTLDEVQQTVNSCLQLFLQVCALYIKILEF